MSYLPREERRISVLETTIRIIAEHGLEGATVRRVCTAAGISAGNIHHLFGSAAELKREAFRHFAEIEIAKLDAAADKPLPMEQLLAYLSSVSNDMDKPTEKIWKSAGQEAGRDPSFAELWKEKAEIWLSRIADLLQRISGNDHAADAAAQSAWRLMSFSVGVTSFAGVGGYGSSPDSVNDHLRRMIDQELAVLALCEPESEHL